MPLPPAAARALDHLARFGIHLGLDHVGRLLAALGDPHLAFPTVLVAGTNGKGSTATLLAAMAAAAGLRTGLYTSPHLETVEERVRVDGAPVDGGRLGDHLLAVLAAADRTGLTGDRTPTYFEALTAAAHLAFREAAVDLAVLEVGLGGRLDATNTARPELSVITPVSLEHRQWLGDTLGAVAGEKAGVLRRDRPAVAWGADPEVREALVAAAAATGADLAFADDQVQLHRVEPLPPVPWGGLRVELTTPVRSHRLETALAGRHQAVNLALAVRAAERLAERGWDGLDGAAIAAGAAAARWPGRLESIRLPVGNGDPAEALQVVILDAAHNPAAAEALAAALDEAAAAGGRPPVLLFGVLSDKEVEGMLPPLAARCGPVVLTRPPGDRGRDPEELTGLLPAGKAATVVAGPEAALERALDLARASASPATPPRPILVCGSIFLVGAVRAELRRRLGGLP